MSTPNSRETLKDWCLRSLGWPVIDINVDDDQVDDRLDEALQYFQDFHFDGVEKNYLKYQLTGTDITNQWIPITESIISVSRIFPLGSALNTGNIFNFEYQWRLNDMASFTATSFTNYVLMQQQIALFERLFVGEIPVRFNRHTNKLFLDWDWSKRVAGDWIVVEGYTIIDPESYTDVYNDRMLKTYLTALIKRQWGNNLKKFEGVQLPGGVTMNGQQIFLEADAEIEKIEDKIRSMYEAPPMFIMG
jgi:hypothetical protein